MTADDHRSSRPGSASLPVPDLDTRSLDDLVRVGDVAFLVTPAAESFPTSSRSALPTDAAMSSRPLSVAGVHGAALTFLVDSTARWFDAVGEHGAEVHLTISTGRNDWIALRGRTAVSADRPTVESLWNPAAAACADGPDDPRLRVLQVSVMDGQYWSAPRGGPLGRLAAVVGAAWGRGGSAPGNHHGEIARD